LTEEFADILQCEKCGAEIRDEVCEFCYTDSDQKYSNASPSTKWKLLLYSILASAVLVGLHVLSDRYGIARFRYKIAKPWAKIIDSWYVYGASWILVSVFVFVFALYWADSRRK